MKTLFLILFILSACSHRDKIKKDHLIGGMCEQEFNKAPVSQGQEIWQKVTETSGTGVSYLVTGLSYSTDFVVSFTGGLIGGLAVCSPLIAIDLAASSSSSGADPYIGQCIGEVGVAVGKTINPNLGPKTSSMTEKWKCPNLDSMAEGLIRVANCYEENNQHELAVQQFNKMHTSPVFRRCLSKKLQKQIAAKVTNQ